LICCSLTPNSSLCPHDLVAAENNGIPLSPMFLYPESYNVTCQSVHVDVDVTGKSALSQAAWIDHENNSVVKVLLHCARNIAF